MRMRGCRQARRASVKQPLGAPAAIHPTSSRRASRLFVILARARSKQLVLSSVLASSSCQVSWLWFIGRNQANLSNESRTQPEVKIN